MKNRVAIGMYERFGYSVYRRVEGYYHSGSAGSDEGEEDAFGTYDASRVVNGRYEETAEAGQVKTECERKWTEFYSFTARGGILIRLYDYCNVYFVSRLAILDHLTPAI
jgi:hypothetical protein